MYDKDKDMAHMTQLKSELSEVLEHGHNILETLK